jgi:hypothetical protein
MLKIMESESRIDGITARLEGQIRGQWVDEVRNYCERLLEDGHLVTLDVKDVSFLDRDAVTLLRQLTIKGVRLVNRTAFLAELLRSETAERS